MPAIPIPQPSLPTEEEIRLGQLKRKQIEYLAVIKSLEDIRIDKEKALKKFKSGWEDIIQAIPSLEILNNIEDLALTSASLPHSMNNLDTALPVELKQEYNDLRSQQTGLINTLADNLKEIGYEKVKYLFDKWQQTFDEFIQLNGAEIIKAKEKPEDNLENYDELTYSKSIRTNDELANKIKDYQNPALLPQLSAGQYGPSTAMNVLSKNCLFIPFSTSMLELETIGLDDENNYQAHLVRAMNKILRKAFPEHTKELGLEKYQEVERVLPLTYYFVNYDTNSKRMRSNSDTNRAVPRHNMSPIRQHLINAISPQAYRREIIANNLSPNDNWEANIGFQFPINANLYLNNYPASSREIWNSNDKIEKLNRLAVLAKTLDIPITLSANVMDMNGKKTLYRIELLNISEVRQAKDDKEIMEMIKAKLPPTLWDFKEKYTQIEQLRLNNKAKLPETKKDYSHPIAFSRSSELLRLSPQGHSPQRTPYNLGPTLKTVWGKKRDNLDQFKSKIQHLNKKSRDLSGNNDIIRL